MFLRAAPADTPRLGDVGVNLTMLAYTLVVAVVSAIACGLIPAVRASAPDLSRLRESGRGSTRRRHWGRNGLVVAQTALALVLLISAGLLIRSFMKLNNVKPCTNASGSQMYHSSNRISPQVASATMANCRAATIRCRAGALPPTHRTVSVKTLSRS